MALSLVCLGDVRVTPDRLVQRHVVELQAGQLQVVPADSVDLLGPGLPVLRDQRGGDTGQCECRDDGRREPVRRADLAQPVPVHIPGVGDTLQHERRQQERREHGRRGGDPCQTPGGPVRHLGWVRRTMTSTYQVNAPPTRRPPPRQAEPGAAYVQPPSRCARPWPPAGARADAVSRPAGAPGRAGAGAGKAPFAPDSRFPVPSTEPPCPPAGRLRGSCLTPIDKGQPVTIKQLASECDEGPCPTVWGIAESVRSFRASETTSCGNRKQAR